MPDILHRVGMQAPAETVFKALSEEKGLAGPLDQECQGPARASGGNSIPVRRARL
jgi:hypothetical protein